MYIKALVIRREKLNEDHSDTTMVVGCLGDVLDQKGDFGRAEPLLREATERHAARPRTAELDGARISGRRDQRQHRHRLPR